jgi:hypothetical protein
MSASMSLEPMGIAEYHGYRGSPWVSFPLLLTMLWLHLTLSSLLWVKTWSFGLGGGSAESFYVVTTLGALPWSYGHTYLDMSASVAKLWSFCSWRDGMIASKLLYIVDSRSGPWRCHTPRCYACRVTLSWLTGCHLSPLRWAGIHPHVGMSDGGVTTCSNQVVGPWPWLQHGVKMLGSLSFVFIIFSRLHSFFSRVPL